MPTPRLPSVDSEADRFEAALKSARIPEKLHDGLWDVWVDDTARAHHLVARFKDSGATPAVRTKAADPIDVAVQQLRQAKDEDARLAALKQLDTLTRPVQAKAGGRISDNQKATAIATKEALTPIQQIARQTMPELYGEKKK